MKILHTLLVVALLVAVGCKKKPETLVEGGYDQEEMDRAIARARAETDAFLKVLASGDADSFSVKAPIKEGGETEHFWLTDVRYENGEFIGLIGNDPGMVTTVKFGQEWRLKKAEISDWMFMRDDKIHGGYTIDPLLPTLSKEEAEAMRERLVR